MLFYRILFFVTLATSIYAVTRCIARYRRAGREVALATAMLPERAPELWTSIGKPQVEHGGSRLFGDSVRPFWPTLMWVLGDANAFQLPADVWEVCARVKGHVAAGHRWLFASWGVWLLAIGVVAIRVWMKYGLPDR